MAPTETRWLVARSHLAFFSCASISPLQEYISLPRSFCVSAQMPPFATKQNVRRNTSCVFTWTAHVHLTYSYSTRLCHRTANDAASSSLLGSLWQLFRGRKRNVLRCRVDTCMYDACQLLLGTLVFTVLSFLTPTISVYYTFFCIVQAVSVGGQVRPRFRL